MQISMKDMLAAGVHFGHRHRYWEPSMKEFIYGKRDGISIINLDKTVKLMEKAFAEMTRVAANNGKIVFVGTKQVCSDAVKAAAEECGQFYVNKRWTGGLLTNWKTTRQSISRLKQLEKESQDGTFDKLTKKEALSRQHDLDKKEKDYGGIKEMSGLPDLLFVLSANHQEIAIKEAVKLGIPVISIVDSNSKPDGVDFVIPGNDDAIKAISLYLEYAVQAVNEGKAQAASKKEADKAE